MCRNFLWCYVCVLTLLDLSLNTKLTAYGKSHEVGIQDSLREGIPFQEWDKESWGEGIGSIEMEDEGEAIDGVLLDPPVLRFGRCALAVPHARTVTLVNTANSTLHLASVAGTTPDFHASFFESKTLAPQGNTTFTVVYLGRREGPVSARLYIHTSLGVHKYAVSAVGESSEYEVWPLVGVRVPLNATVEWELRLHNPTDTTVQVSEIYSSGSWLSLSLPGGEASAGSGLWAVPSRHTRPLVRMRIAPLTGVPQPLTAYLRVRANIPGGGLVLPVEARSVPAGEHARPLHVRLRARGSGDPPHTVEVEMANSGATSVRLEGGVRAACRAAPAADPCGLQPHRANGASSSGAELKLTESQLGPFQGYKQVGKLTLHYGELWTQATMAGAGAAEGAWCSGCVLLGGATVPYSVRVLPGALALRPPQLHFVTAEGGSSLPRDVTAHNEFQLPLRVEALHLPDQLDKLFRVVDHTPITIAAGESAVILQLKLLDTAVAAGAVLDAQLTVHTNLSAYHLPLRLYSGKFSLEWEWGNHRGGIVDLGTVGISTTRRVYVRLHNPSPLALCLTGAAAALPGAAAALVLPTPLPYCLEPGGRGQLALTVVAPAREVHLRGELALHTPHARCTHSFRVRTRAGRLRPLSLLLPPVAPYTLSSVDLVMNNSMATDMRVVAVTQATNDAALVYEPLRPKIKARSVQMIGRVRYEAEKNCRPNCITGLDLHEPQGQEWLKRETQYDAAALRADLALLRERLALHDKEAGHPRNLTLLVHTDEVMQVTVSGVARTFWPRLVPLGAGCAGRGGVKGVMPLRLLLRNVASVPLLLSVRLPSDVPPRKLPYLAGGDANICMTEKCTWSRRAFNLTGWRATRGTARLWRDGAVGQPVTQGGAAEGGGSLPPMLLAPRTELELLLVFVPPEPGTLTAYLFLRNNLTILEAVQVYGEGEVPAFDIAGRKPGSTNPFVFEVSECLWSPGPDGVVRENAAAVVERVVSVRNTGRVDVRLKGWSISGGGCVSNGFRLRPCGTLVVPPGTQTPLHIAFKSDYTLSKVFTTLRAQTDVGPVEFLLRGYVPVRLLYECSVLAPRPPWESTLRAVGTVMVFVALVLIVAAGTVDAERFLRRARAARPPSPPRAPLDLRSLATPEPQPAAPRAPVRKRKTPRRVPVPMDPEAERRAFERWRSEVLRRDEDSSRSSDEDTTGTVNVRASPTPPKDDDVAPEMESRTPTPPTDEDERVEGQVQPPDDDVVTSSSNSSNVSTPIEDCEDAEDESYAGDAEPDARDDSPTDGFEVISEPKITQDLSRSSPAKCMRGSRIRREASESARRSERVRVADIERRTALVRPHARKERTRRRERAPPSPPAPSGSETGCETGNESRGGVRWGASWSSVVSGDAGDPAPLPPIGSDVRRREVDHADQSLFYFNGVAVPRRESYMWQPPRDTYMNNNRDYMEDCQLGAPGMQGGWWGGGWNSWGGAGPLRPPPGFTAPPPPQRPFDPFRSLASIWAPAPNDWRVADGSGSSNAPPTSSPPCTPLARSSPDDELK